MKRVSDTGQRDCIPSSWLFFGDLVRCGVKKSTHVWYWSVGVAAQVVGFFITETLSLGHPFRARLVLVPSAFDEYFSVGDDVGIPRE